ncbi:MAG: sensor histidine kinase N-terminal domain-containing protein [Gammaproteobacteria bacterium]|nr:sensor histidine kinase N-terminal domain-containing protein [Gammaproteobacteria bacterium]
MRSIRSRLVLWVVGLVLLIWTLMVSLTWWSVSIEIHPVFDAQLAQAAHMLAATARHESEERDLDAFVTDLHAQGYEYPVVFQIWSAQDRLLLRGPGAPPRPLSKMMEPGYSNSQLNDGLWRVFTLYTSGSGSDRQVFRIQVAGKIENRRRLIEKFAVNALKPLLLLLPFSALIWIGINRALKPLQWITDQIACRDQSNLEVVSTTRVPVEISVLVNEINALLIRLRASLDRYSQFAANAAHELRTPLAGAMAQLQVALQADSDSQQRRALDRTLEGLRRLNHRVEQLLTLARIEPERMRLQLESFDLSPVAAQVVADLIPRALSKGIELSLHTAGPVHLKGNRELVEILLGNLLDNSITAMGKGGEAVLCLETANEGVIISLQDSGPGIPQALQARVFERHHSLPGPGDSGYGLGLSIVKVIAEIHSASVTLDNRPEGGLRVTVRFP